MQTWKRWICAALAGTWMLVVAGVGTVAFARGGRQAKQPSRNDLPSQQQLNGNYRGADNRNARFDPRDQRYQPQQQTIGDQRGWNTPAPQSSRYNNNGYYNNGYDDRWAQPYNTTAANSYYQNSTPRPAVNLTAPVRLTPTPAVRPTPLPAQPLTARESAAAQLLTQTRKATWNAYENYSDRPGYAETYRELHRLLQTVKKLASETKRQASADTVSGPLADALREAEISLQIVQIQTEVWNPTAAAITQADQTALQSQLKKMSATLASLMAASNVKSQIVTAVADEPATVIRARE